MIDIKFLRENPDIVKENIKKKFQDQKLPLVDEVIALDKERRDIQAEADAIRAEKNQISKQIGALMGQGKKDDLITVSDGYARNFLIPKKLAVEADSKILNDIRNKEAAKARRAELERKAALEMAERFKGMIMAPWIKTIAPYRRLHWQAADLMAEAIQRTGL